MNKIRKKIIDFAVNERDYNFLIKQVGKNSETNKYIVERLNKTEFNSLAYFNILLKIKDTKELHEIINMLLNNCGSSAIDVLRRMLNDEYYLGILPKDILGKIAEKFAQDAMDFDCYNLIDLLAKTNDNWLYDYMCKYIKMYPLRCLKIITYIKDFSSFRDNEKLIALRSDLEDNIIDNNNYNALIELANIINNSDKFKKIESKILLTKDDKLIFDFVSKVGDECNKQDFIDILSKSRDLTTVIKTAIYLDNSLLNNINSVEEFLLIISFLDIKDEEKNKLLSDAMRIVSLNSANKYKDDLNKKYISMLKDGKPLAKTNN